MFDLSSDSLPRGTEDSNPSSSSGESIANLFEPDKPLAVYGIRTSWPRISPGAMNELLAYLTENCCGRDASCVPACNPADAFATGEDDEAPARARGC
jgi:hypothetical protein